MIDGGRPRYWIGWYDRWNLVLPAAFVGVLVWLLVQPRPAIPPPAPAPARPQVVPLAAPTLESPASGTQARMGTLPNVEGRALPGTTVILYYSQAPSLERRELGRARVGGDGRYRFGLAGFPAGGYVLQVISYADDGRSAVSTPVDIWVTDPRPAQRVVPRPSRSRTRN